MKWAIRACLFMAALVVPLPAAASGYGDKQCLAEAMYFEARDQGWRGMLAVGVVIQNRVRDTRYPNDACGVVRQGKYRNGNPVKHKCQFSYYCDGKPERPAEKEAWATARDLASMLMTTGVTMVGLDQATHYHTTAVNPYWAKSLVRVEQIGRHVFYAQK